MPRWRRRSEIVDRSRQALLIGTGAARNFGSIAAFLAVGLLAVGAYLLKEAITQPLAAGSVDVIGAALLITMAATMIFHLLEPHASAISRRRRRGKAIRTERTTTLHLPLFPAREHPPYAGARAATGSDGRPAYEFTLRLEESPRDSVPQEAGGDAVRDLR